MKPFIGIKKIWYGEPLKAAPTRSSLEALVAGMEEVTNSHDGTWSYTQDDPAVTDYLNELSGKPYYRDMTSAGNKTIAFTLGVYAFADRVALQGGTEIEENGKIVGWSAPTTPELKNKSIIAMTKTGNFIVFTNAGIVAKTNAAEKNLGLGITAVAMDNETEGVADEYLFDGEGLKWGEEQS